MANETKTATPVYFSTLQLTNFVKQLADTTVPIKIDKGVIGSLSGSAQTTLLSGLRFLGLVGEDGTTLKPLRDLVDAHKAGSESWKPALRAVLNRAYEHIVRGVDLENGTWITLEKAFVASGVREGQMSEKCVRFYVAAMVEAGAKISHYITKAKGRTTGGRTLTPKKPKADSATGANGGGGAPNNGTPLAAPKSEQPTPEGYMDVPVHFPERASPGVIRVPRDITAKEFRLLEHALKGVKLFAGLEEGGAG